ncbi:MAG: T9SS type A sorting domain-containing protein, partial [Chlorobi bacterium]|nr:T9SS type A sorting domain-containing protein [Chlorobiota bacterium]
ADGNFIDIIDLNDSIFYITSETKSSDGDISDNPWPGHSNIWTLQINKEGDILWEGVHGGSLIDWTRDMEVTDDGGLIVLSLSNSPDGDVSNPNGSWDLWLIKLNSDGETEWDFSLGGEGGESGGSIIETQDGGYIVIGSTEGIGGGNFDTTCNYHGTPGGGYVDVWVVKLDSLRNIEWQQCYGGHYLDEGSNILETDDGYICLSTTMSNDGDVSGFHGVPGNMDYGHDIWVFKVDKQGNLLWQNCLGGLYLEWARDIFPTTDGGYMIVGTTASDDGDVEGYHGIDTGIYDDVWFAKIDSLGQLTWQYCYGGTGLESLYRGVYQKGDYNYVICLGTDTDAWQCAGQMWPDLRIVELYDSTVGIIENNPESSGENLSVEVFPNPTNERITFAYTLPSGNTSGKLSVFSSSGKLVRGFDLMAKRGQVVYNTSGLNPGVYFYTLRALKQKTTGKFVIL